MRDSRSPPKRGLRPAKKTSRLWQCLCLGIKFTFPKLLSKKMNGRWPSPKALPAQCVILRALGCFSNLLGQKTSFGVPLSRTVITFNCIFGILFNAITAERRPETRRVPNFGTPTYVTDYPPTRVPVKLSWPGHFTTLACSPLKQDKARIRFGRQTR
jgi:hypothetical protein